jgi:hypothetical protein
MFFVFKIQINIEFVRFAFDVGQDYLTLFVSLCLLCFKTKPFHFASLLPSFGITQFVWLRNCHILKYNQLVSLRLCPLFWYSRVRFSSLM